MDSVEQQLGLHRLPGPASGCSSAATGAEPQLLSGGGGVAAAGGCSQCSRLASAAAADVGRCAAPIQQSFAGRRAVVARHGAGAPGICMQRHDRWQLAATGACQAAAAQAPDRQTAASALRTAWHLKAEGLGQVPTPAGPETQPSRYVRTIAGYNGIGADELPAVPPTCPTSMPRHSPGREQLAADSCAPDATEPRSCISNLKPGPLRVGSPAHRKPYFRAPARPCWRPQLLSRAMP